MAFDTQLQTYTVKPDIVCGQGAVQKNGETAEVDLWMDWWAPVDQDLTMPRPTVIFTHGGASHLGSPRFTYDVAGAQTTSPAQYCQTYATRGFNCFAISYRLTQDLPIPSGAGYDTSQLDPSAIEFVIERVNQVRIANDLPPLDPLQDTDRTTMMNGIRAATEDLNVALQFILTNADRYGVDPERIVLHGFSAGAVTSVHVAYALNAPVAAVIANSGGPVGFDISRTVTADSPPMLLFVGQHDLEAAVELAPYMRDLFAATGIAFDFNWVPGAGHFYPSAATSLGADAIRVTIDQRITEFLTRVFGE